MNVIEHIKEDSHLISFEITPPERGGEIDRELKVVEELKKYNPSFIQITSRASEIEYKETQEGLYQKRIVRKRPGTSILCARIQYEHQIDTVSHILCRGFTQQETEDILIELNYGNIKNVFAVRGDENVNNRKLDFGRTINENASQLIKQIDNMNKGKYLEDIVEAKRTNFCIGGACYPEKHFSSPNLQTDLDFLKEKIDNGMQYAITQMFFSNNKYFEFLEKCRQQGITIPILPGITTLVSKSQLYGKNGIPSRFNCVIPYELSRKMINAKEEDVKKISIEFATKQAQDLIEQKARGVHFFVYKNTNSTLEVLKNIRSD